MSNRARHQTFNTVRPASAEPVSGLDFLSNETANSSVRFWLPVSAIPRVGHSFIWRAKLRAQAGYGAELAHCGSNISDWLTRPNGVGYEFITCYHPCDGTYYSNGQRDDAGATGSAGTVHYDEIAGIGNMDYICSPSAANGAPTLTVVDVWRKRFRSSQYITVSTTDDFIEHIYCPNLDIPTVYIRQLQASGDLNAPDGNGILTIGSHRWTQYETNKNGECTGGVLAGFLGYDAYQTIANAALEIANPGSTAVGASNLTYKKISPTPSDITDDSGRGNHGTWESAAGNSLRPSLWTA